ncbi:cation diffusion facilitator family transporter [Amnibacterium kyonggiense]|uniref:Cobalt-zinc-cadmium efflux system protein n=1 Tax=Amnibacterium kyonggiense TaxID=595671 RepID=A0A4R7FQA2_9MICO|nr:cation diffusion facilitator family transporter [Amnibacterium kyonggiense]TDS79951.1 cobalt-zinc-cadmium efflux system protein [Amnibacterium kyonggiense]
MHDHDHGHGGTPTRALAVVLAITASVLVAEVVGALLTGSLALLVDAAHVLTDVLGLGLALAAARLAARSATARRTYGWARAEVLGAAAQAAVLLGVGVFVVVEAIRRFTEPADVPGPALLVFGAIGLLGNLVAVVVLRRSGGADLNTRAARLEVLNDALGSVGVLIAGLVIALTGWTRADGVAALLVGALIVPRTLLLLRDALDVLLEAVPRGLDLEEVRGHLLEQEHVLAVHDLHATRVSSSLPVLSAHVVIEPVCFRNGTAPAVLDALQHCVAAHFPVSLTHSTFQLEPPAHTAHEAGTHA